MENPVPASSFVPDSKRVALTAGTAGTPVGPSSSNDSRPSVSPTVAPTDTAPVLPTGGSSDEVMDEPPSGSISLAAPPSSDDVPMDQPSPAAAPGSSPPRASPRPTMADVLGQQEHLRRDHAEADAARRRVETPKPLASDIEWIEHQYAAGGDWSFIASRIDQARPYTLPRAKYDMVIATGRTLAKTPLQKIMVSLAGDLRIKVKSKEACLRLKRTKVNILGGAYTFKEFDVLGGKYFIDISNMDSDTDTHLILQRLFLLGCKPVYDTFREVNLATGITSATGRVYFLTSSCPSALIVNDSVRNQVVFDNKLHPAHGKNAPFQSERLPFGYRSHHGLDLGTTTCAYPSTVPEYALLPRQHQKQPAQTYAQVVKAPAVAVLTKIPQKSSLQQAVEKAKKREGQSHHGA
uniref:Uncharacterized protein n=1 Tax=Hyaloperonospora arabidopsidis (strain Emoy2) TaxID=559515 RepID=M4BT88_HYAAE